MGKNTPQAPPPPDPVAVSNAQSASNIATAQAQQKLNMVNTNGPTGAVHYNVDPNAPGGYSQDTTLSAPEQQTYDLSKQAQNGALNTANTQLGRVNDALATPLSTSGLPDLVGAAGHRGQMLNYDQGGNVQTTFDGGQPLKYSFDPGQSVQGHIGPQDLAAASKQAQDAAYGQATSRLDPQFAQDENALRTRLANQGLSQNSDAYQTALQNEGRTKNDAYASAQNAAVTQGNAAAQQLFDQSATQGQFANQAAAQEYAQNQGQAGFHNATAGQDYSQNLGAAQFANAGQAQQNAENAAQAAFYNNTNNTGFNQDIAAGQLSNTARNQGLQERAYIQNQPINQFTGLLGLGQVGQPQGINYTPSQVANTDVIGANALTVQAQQAAANRASQQQSGLMGGLMSLGSAAIMASDRRLKTDIRLLRKRRDGVGVYRFRYRVGGPVRVGVMAQELQRVRPDLVVKGRDGFLAVNYAGLGAL